MCKNIKNSYPARCIRFYLRRSTITLCIARQKLCVLNKEVSRCDSCFNVGRLYISWCLLRTLICGKECALNSTADIKSNHLNMNWYSVKVRL